MIFMMANMRLSIKTLLNYLAVLSVFTGMSKISFAYCHNAEFRFAYVLMAIILILWLPFLKNIYFNKIFLLVFIVISFFSLINVFLGNNELLLLMKQVVGILGFAVFYYVLLKVNDYDVRRLFEIYLTVAFFVALIGIIQEVSFLLNFRPGYDFRFFSAGWTVVPESSGKFLRINSIFREPAHFCAVMIPAGFAAITSFFRNDHIILSKWKSAVILLAILFTFSTMGYLGLLFSLLMLSFNHKRFDLKLIILNFLLVFVLVFLGYNYVGEFRGRIGSVIAVVRGRQKIEDANLSVYAFFSNAKVAYYSFKNNPLFGSGLGSHELSHKKCVDKKVIRVSTKSGGFPNRKDANSFLLRLISETGLFGVIVFFIFIFKFYVNRSRDGTDHLWVISNSMLVMFVVKLIRMGHYFADGFFFFFWIYYFTERASAVWKREHPINKIPFSGNTKI